MCQPSESVLTRRAMLPTRALPPLLPPPSAAPGDDKSSAPFTKTALRPMRYGLVAGLAAGGCLGGVVGTPATQRLRRGRYDKSPKNTLR